MRNVLGPKGPTSEGRLTLTETNDRLVMRWLHGHVAIGMVGGSSKPMFLDVGRNTDAVLSSLRRLPCTAVWVLAVYHRRDNRGSGFMLHSEIWNS